MEHLFEKMQKDIDFSKEYKKLEIMISYDKEYYNGFSYSINEILSSLFLNWKKRDIYTSLDELRRQIGLPINLHFTKEQFESMYKEVNINQYFLFCEMILNLVSGLNDDLIVYKKHCIQLNYVFDTINAVVDKCGFEIRTIKDELCIIEKNAAAIEVASINLDISDVILEYNSFLLKGNLKRKQELLKQIADLLEPKRKELKELSSSNTEDFFLMVNKMNVRHNNCDKSDSSHYVKQFAILSDKEKELWYDDIYEQALSLFMLLNSKKRKERIDKFKAAL